MPMCFQESFVFNFNHKMWRQSANWQRVTQGKGSGFVGTYLYTYSEV